MQSLPSAPAIASADHVAHAGSSVKTSSSTLVSTKMSVMAAHGIEVAAGAPVRGAPVLARLDQRVEGRLARCLGATRPRLLHDNMAVDLAEVDGRTRCKAVPLSYFERDGDFPFGGNASRHGSVQSITGFGTSNTMLRRPFQSTVSMTRAGERHRPHSCRGPQGVQDYPSIVPSSPAWASCSRRRRCLLGHPRAGRRRP